MDFEIPESLVTVLLGMIEANSPLAKRLNEHGVCHGKMLVPSRLFDAAAFNILYDLCKAKDERALMFQTLAQDNILGAPQARKIPSLDLLVPGLAAYFSRDVIDGWLYKRGKDESRPTPPIEVPVTNNMVLKKLRVAFELKEEDMHAILKAADFPVSKPELSALVRKVGHSNYRACGDQLLRNFLKGLALRGK